MSGIQEHKLTEVDDELRKIPLQTMTESSPPNDTNRRVSVSMPQLVYDSHGNYIGDAGMRQGYYFNPMTHVRKQRRLDLKKQQSTKKFHYRPTVEPVEINEWTPIVPVDSVDSDAGPEDLSWQSHLFQMIFHKWISVLLIFLPPAYISYKFHWSPVYVFWLNFLGMVPLASILGDFTEELSLHTNQVIGGLINATFGNAVEVVVAVQALLADEIRVVQASMIGSVLSNLLLVLGCCFFFGGLVNKEQKFNAMATTANMGLLALATIGMVLPTPFAEYYNVQDEHVLMVSRAAAIFLMLMYFQLLIFQLKTHAELLSSDDEEEEEPSIPFWVALTGLTLVTALVAIFSDFLVASIDGYVEESGMSRTFVGVVVLPIVGNAVEHITAVSVAMKNKMDLSIGVAVGSSVQVALFVVPFIIIVGWIAKKPMTLNFPHFEIILFTLSVIIVHIVLSNAKTNWLEGSLLITTYVMLGVGFWFEDVVSFR